MSIISNVNANIEFQNRVKVVLATNETALKNLAFECIEGAINGDYSKYAAIVALEGDKDINLLINFLARNGLTPDGFTPIVKNIEGIKNYLYSISYRGSASSKKDTRTLREKIIDSLASYKDKAKDDESLKAEIDAAIACFAVGESEIEE